MSWLDYVGADGPFDLVDVSTGEVILTGTRRECDVWRGRYPHRDLCLMRTVV